MMHLRQTVLLAAVVAISLCSASVDPVKLIRRVTVGEEHSYKMSMVVSVMGIEVKIKGDASETVLEVNDDGSYVQEETQSDHVATMAGQVQIPPPDVSAKVTYSKTGEILKVELDMADPDAILAANLTAMIWPTKPVDVGSNWEVVTEIDEYEGGSTIDHKFEIVARETLLGHDTFKISFNSRETSDGEATCKATVWVDIQSGLTVKIIAELLDVPSGGLIVDTVTFTVTLVE